MKYKSWPTLISKALKPLPLHKYVCTVSGLIHKHLHEEHVLKVSLRLKLEKHFHKLSCSIWIIENKIFIIKIYNPTKFQSLGLIFQMRHISSLKLIPKNEICLNFTEYVVVVINSGYILCSSIRANLWILQVKQHELKQKWAL